MKQIFTLLFLSFFATKMNAQSITNITCPGSCGAGSCDVVFSGLSPAGGTLQFQDNMGNILGDGFYDGTTGLLTCIPAGTTQFHEGFLFFDPIFGPMVLYSPFPIIVIATPLSVKLTTFTVNQLNNKNILAWQTATEQNAKSFEVQKSTDAETFKTIGSVAASGNSNTPINYTYADAQATNGVVYYRLKQVDVDGKFEYSSVVNITNTLNNEVIIVNNPIQKGNKIHVISKTPYKIFNLVGQEVKDLNTLQAGTYLIKNKTGNTAKLVVQ